MIRYSIKQVIIGRIPNIDKEQMGKFNDKVAIVIPKQENSAICVMDRENKEAIDIFEPENHYPILVEKDDLAMTKEPIDKNKSYVLKIEKSPYTGLDRMRIMRQLKEKGII